MSDTKQCALPIYEGEKRRTASVPLRIKRRISQLVMLALLGQWSFYGIFRCPFLVPYVSCQNCPVITCHGRIFTIFWGYWLLLPLSALLFGRAFCGWGCPGGLLSETIGRLAPLKLRVRNTFSRFAPSGKYLGLAVALVCYYILAQPRVDVPIRIGEFFQSVVLTFEHANLEWLVRTFFVLGVFAAGLVVANAWCRFACPAGGVLELARHLSLFRFYKTSNCNSCNKCLDVCHMGSRPDEANCTACGDCQEVCPSGAIAFGRRK